MTAFTKLNLKNSLNYFLSKIGIINNTKYEEKRISKAVGIFCPFDCIDGIKPSLAVFPKSSNTIIYLLHNFIRGFQYYDGEDVFENLKEGDSLELIRDFENKYDRYAIVLYWNGQKLRYVAREKDNLFAKLLF